MGLKKKTRLPWMALVFSNGQHMKNVAQGGVDDANEEEIGQGLPRQPLEKRDILEHGQSQLSKQRASNLRPAQQQKGAQLQTAPEKAARR